MMEGVAGVRGECGRVIEPNPAKCVNTKTLVREKNDDGGNELSVEIGGKFLSEHETGKNQLGYFSMKLGLGLVIFCGT